MFNEIRIKSYRGLRSSVLADLQQINIITGANNSGKTSLLEAIQLFDHKDILSNLLTIAKRREPQMLIGVRGRMQPFDMLLYSFSMQDHEKEILVTADSSRYGECMAGIRAEYGREILFQEEVPEAEWNRYQAYCDEDETIRCLEGAYYFERKERSKGEFYFNEAQRSPLIWPSGEEKSGLRPVMTARVRRILYTSPLDLYTNKVISASLYKGMLAEEKRRLLELLHMFDERIMGVEMGMRYGSPVTFLELSDAGLVPISAFGDGLKKVLTLAGSIVRVRRGALLIDEFETGIHKRALMQVAQWLTAAANRYEVQVFLTTHSRDAIDALISAQQNYDDISAYRMEHYKNRIYVKQFQGTELYRLVQNQGMDIL